MIPGNVHPLMMSGGHWESHYKIGHGLRLRASASAYLSRTLGTPTSNTVWSLSLWLKRGKLGENHCVLFASPAEIYFQYNDTLGFYQSGLLAASSGVFRDPTAHGHLFIRSNGTNIKAYWNNAEVLSYTGTMTALNSAIAHGIGGPAGVDYFDGMMSDIHFVDGQALTPLDFGRVCPDKGHWEPAKYNGTYGNNGFWLDFSDGTSATTLGYDHSGRSNNWTPINISVASGNSCDWLTDTPTNNHPTLNPLNMGAAWPPKNGGLAFDTAPSNSYAIAQGSVSFPAVDVWQFEVEVTALGGSIDPIIGIMDAAYTPHPPDRVGGSAPAQLGYGPAEYSYVKAGQKYSNGAASGYGAAFTTGDVIGVKVDRNAQSIEFFKNGASQGVAFTGISSTLTFVPAVCIVNGPPTSAVAVNFGQRAFAYPITGAKALCAANEQEPSIVKSATAFFSATGSGANIQDTLAAKRAGWAAYIEIFKRRDSAEGWRWRFSDDAGNYLDSSSTAAKAAFPALSGTSYIGYALRVSASNGVATGTFAHTNGVADTISDNLGNTRKAIILKRESAAGDNWFFYHPDLTAGKLLYLNLSDAETTDASIGTVLANSFVAAAALPSGTYRWIALAEVASFLKLGTLTGNGAADGSYALCGQRPGLVLEKCKSNTISNYWPVWDATRNPGNATNHKVGMSRDDAEDSVALGTSSQNMIDLVSTGFKLRDTLDTNTSSYTYVYLAIAEFPSRYSNAR